MRIFIGLSEIAGYYHRLAQGLESLGQKVIFADLSGHHFQYPTQTDPILIALTKTFLKKTKAAKSIPIKYFFSLIYYFFKLLLFIYAFFSCDAFIFSYGNSFFKTHDLKLLKLFRKKIVVVFNGSDTRPAYLDGCLLNQLGTTEKLIIHAARQKRKILQIEQFADYCICLTHSAQFLTKPFITWLSIGIPTPELKEVLTFNSPKLAEKKIVRILHVFSDPARGTYVIRQAINELKNRGYLIDYRELSGVPHAKVLEEIQKSDFVIDGIYSDTPMGGFSTEAAKLGKPAILAGYGWSELYSLHDQADIPPSTLCEPEALIETIEHFIQNEALVLELGEKAKFFVEQNWSAISVAQRYLQLLTNDFPSRWLADPQELRYIFGACIDKTTMKSHLKKILELQGKNALQLQDKPELEQLLIDFSSSDILC